VKQRRLKWADIIVLFDYPAAIRKAIYTTNVIESVNSVIRKYTRNRKQYQSTQGYLRWVGCLRPPFPAPDRIGVS
jgi:transposase-like protein